MNQLLPVRHLLQLLGLAFLTLAPSGLAAQSPWEHLPEPFAGAAYPPLETPDGILTFVPGRGLMISNDDGRSWGPYGSTPYSAIPVAYSDSLLLAFGTGERALYQLWGEGDSIGTANLGVTGIVRWAQATPDMTTFVMTSDGLFVSDDIGRTWRKLPNDFGEVSGVVSFGFDGDRVLVVANGRAWFSGDFGETFREITANVGTVFYNGTINRSGEIMIGTLYGLYTSDDDGETFDYFSLSREVPMVYGRIGEDAAGNYYTGTTTGFFYRISPDGLVRQQIPIASRYALTTTTLSSGTTFIGDFITGMWRSTDEGFEQTGMPYATRPTDFHRNADGEIMVLLGSGVASSPDEGESWDYHYVLMERAPGSIREETVGFLPLGGDTIIGFGITGSVVRWVGEQEPKVYHGVLGFGMTTAIETSGGAILVTSDSNSARSTDGGRSWTPVAHSSRSLALAGDGSIWSAAGRLFVSRNDGASFTPVTAPVDTAVSVLEGPDGSLYLVGRTGSDEVHTVSTDNGATWQSVELPCDGSDYYSIEEMGGPGGLGAISDCGVQYWDPERLEWKRAIIELPENERGFTALFHSGGYLFAGGLGGVWRIADEIVSAPADGPPPLRLDLSTTGES